MPSTADCNIVIISIHALREEGDAWCHHTVRRRSISIHALREEGDAIRTIRWVTRTDFYPRPPRGGRLQQLRTEYMGYSISIHALREEGDACSI